MLPSTGYFKGMNCPFYDSGLCERPYCHFRHVKKESQTSSNDGIESGEILQKLVSAAVQRVLQQSDATGSVITPEIPNNVSTKNNTNSTITLQKPVYNPTPISELNKIAVSEPEVIDEISEQKKRHIPVPYTPRKPTSLPIKRLADTNGHSSPLVYIPVKYTPGSADSVQLDPYTPKGSVQSNNVYLPGKDTQLQPYKPQETKSSGNVNYVPSDKNTTKKKVLEYQPTNLVKKNEIPLLTYQPTPRALAPCFSSDEEEPDTKKRKVSGELSGLDDLGPEFDILDQILDEEKDKTDIQINKVKKKDEIIIHIKKKKNEPDKSEKKKSDKKSDELTSHSKKDYHNKSNKHEKSHKSSSKDKEIKKHKHSKEKTNENDLKCNKKSSKYSNNNESSNKHRHSKHKDKKERSSNKLKFERDQTERKSKQSDKEDNDSSTYKSDFEDCKEELNDSSESDEEAIALECKKIFEEYVPTKKIESSDNPPTVVQNEQNDDYIPGKKRISRTADKHVKPVTKPQIKPDFKLSAAQAMSERLAKIREFHATRKGLETSINKIDGTKSTSTTSNPGNNKIRIAHVPYASTLINAKKSISCTIKRTENTSTNSTTTVQTAKKGENRIAHIPNEKFIDRPGVLEPLASKIPANIRSTYLNMMIDECLKIYITMTDAYARAQHEELNTSKKCSTIQIYKNSAVLTVSRLRKEFQECNGVKKSGSDCSTLQATPSGFTAKSNVTGSWSIETKNRNNIDVKEFSGSKLYKNIQKWILTEEQLQVNGFPRPHPSGDKGRAMIYNQNKQKPPKGLFRNCSRCKKDYTINKKGFPAVKEECIYHPNNKYRVRGEARYQCCSQDATADGCCIASSHVYDYVDYENLKGYIKTLPPDKELDDYGVYSLDCEMCYTTHGLDLTRITVINSSCQVVYETLIKPLHPIIDYNTRYSGITEDQMAAVKTTLLDVQATLLTMFTSKTILIGHSLESDFKALKLIHDTVIDTSVLFPHKMGPPYKRALRNLSSEHLKKIIQNSVEGHDSAEDAMVCMELIHYKLKEDLKTR